MATCSTTRTLRFHLSAGAASHSISQRTLRCKSVPQNACVGSLTAFERWDLGAMPGGPGKALTSQPDESIHGLADEDVITGVACLLGPGGNALCHARKQYNVLTGIMCLGFPASVTSSNMNAALCSCERQRNTRRQQERETESLPPCRFTPHTPAVAGPELGVRNSPSVCITRRLEPGVRGQSQV